MGAFWPSDAAAHWVDLSSPLIAIAGGGYALWQYRVAQVWKRAEFTATQMRLFFDKTAITNVLMMIDWSGRLVDLFGAGRSDTSAWVFVRRSDQTHALYPHTLPSAYFERMPSSGVRETDVNSQFSATETAIRDCFDEFLDGLERIGGFLRSNVVTREGLEPYLGYWLRDIAATACPPEDAEWTFVLFNYIAFYKWPRVQDLFAAFELEIRPGGKEFEQLAATLGDRDLVRDLARALRDSSASVAEG